MGGGKLCSPRAKFQREPLKLGVQRELELVGGHKYEAQKPSCFFRPSPPESCLCSHTSKCQGPSLVGCSNAMARAALMLIPRHVVSQSTGGRTLCSAAPAADELLPECVTEIPRIRSMHMTSASLSLPDALTSRDLRRCAFLRFLRNTFRSSRMSRARLRKLAIWSAS